MSTTPTPSVIAETLQQLAAAGADADPQAFDRLLADDVTWTLMGHDVAYARTYTGKAEVYGEYMGKLQARIDHSRSTTANVDVMADDTRGMVAVHNADDLVLVDGSEVSVDVLLLMHISDGKIVSVKEFMDLRPVVAAFGPSLA